MMFSYKIERPDGSIETIKRIELELECVKQDRSEVPFYIVEQMGRITEFMITPNETTIKEDCITFGYMKRHFRDINIGGGGYNNHYAFFNKELAEKYSEQLKNDSEYMNYVQKYWEQCKEDFSGIDDSWEWIDDSEYCLEKEHKRKNN